MSLAEMVYKALLIVALHSFVLVASRADICV